MDPKDGQHEMGAAKPVRAAQYVRMSTEHQKYSTENQSEAIAAYAARRGFDVVRTYTDAGKSGLRLDGRAALQELIADVRKGAPGFEAILVYDVSRWGRFQDADESAYYEFICREAGLSVHYCAEQFENDGSLSATIIKSMKRAMAGEYSRELSAKVFAGQCRLITLGFRQGGAAGYGLRRQLVDEHLSPKGLLERGEQKSIQTDRVVLTPGPLEEVEVVRRLYRMFVVRLWRDRCLIEDGSVFSDERLWSSEVLAEVDAHFNGRPDASKDRFQTKLHRQFQDASPHACRLVAEMLWAMNLFPSNIGPVSKRDAIRDVWSWSGHVLSDDHELIDRETLKGLGSAGPGFLAHRPREVRFFIHAMIAFKAFSVDERRALLDDAWRFAEWLDAVPDEGYRQLKHILPFLLFPDQFERIASPGDIRRILIGLGGFDRRALKQVSKVDQDRALLDLRHKIEEDEGRELDFYDSKFREICPSC